MIVAILRTCSFVFSKDKATSVRTLFDCSVCFLAYCKLALWIDYHLVARARVILSFSFDRNTLFLSIVTLTSCVL